MQVRVISRLLLALAAALAGSIAHAQTDTGSIERTIPKVEVAPEQRQAKVATPSVPAESGARVSGTFVLSAVNIDGATVFSSEELAKSFELYLASRIGQPELDKIAADITERYRRAGYLLSYAVVPEQSVSSGIVGIRVIEGSSARCASQEAAGRRRRFASLPSGSAPSGPCARPRSKERSVSCATFRASSLPTRGSAEIHGTRRATS